MLRKEGKTKNFKGQDDNGGNHKRKNYVPAF